MLNAELINKAKKIDNKDYDGVDVRSNLSDTITNIYDNTVRAKIENEIEELKNDKNKLKEYIESMGEDIADLAEENGFDNADDWLMSDDGGLSYIPTADEEIENMQFDKELDFKIFCKVSNSVEKFIADTVDLIKEVLDFNNFSVYGNVETSKQSFSTYITFIGKDNIDKDGEPIDGNMYTIRLSDHNDKHYGSDIWLYFDIPITDNMSDLSKFLDKLNKNNNIKPSDMDKLI